MQPHSHRGTRGGRRARRPRWRRARGLPGTLGLTALGTLLPGSGFLYAGRRLLGLSLLVPAVALACFAGWYLFREAGQSDSRDEQ